MLPSFIIGGTAAAGTSFLGSAVIQHPDVYLPVPMEPECHFFLKSWEYERGLDYYQKRWFSKASGQRAIGERSSSYLFGGAETARRIHTHLPNVRLVFTMRNPVERAWGNYRFTVLQGLEELDFLDALVREPERVAAQSGRWAEVQPFNYTGRGRYASLLAAYLTLFAKDQILLIKSEAMGKDPAETFRAFFQFVGVDPSFDPQPTPDYVALSVKSPREQVAVREHFGTRITPLLEAVRRAEPVERFIDSAEDEAMLERLKANLGTTKLSMPLEARKLLNGMFAPEIERLAQMVPFDVSDWLDEQI